MTCDRMPQAWRRALRVAALLPLLCAGFAIPPAHAMTLAVTVTLNDANAPGGNSDLIHNGPTDCAVTGTGTCSLRDAVLFANSQTAPDTTTITLPAGTYTLTIPGTGETAAMTGDLNLSQNVTITGAGANTTIIQASATGGAGGAIDRVFTVALPPASTGAVAATLNALTVQNGGNLPANANGGGILLATAGSSLTLNDCVIANNATTANGAGGGIFTGSGTALTLNRTTIRDNTSGGDGGGIASGGGTVSLTDSAIATNTTAGGYGGGIRNASGTLTVTHSTVSGNRATNGASGAIANTGTLTVTGSTVSGNSASSSGGGLTHGGGVATVTGSTFSMNTTGGFGGGAIVNNGAMTVTRSTFSGNSAHSAGGAIYTHTATAQTALTVTDSTFSGNQLTGAIGSGGGIYASGDAVVTNSTFAGNAANANGGGLYLDAGTVRLTNDTVSGNHLDLQGGSGGGIAINGAAMIAVNTLIAGNMQASTGSPGADVSGSFAAGSEHNLIGDGSGALGVSDGDAAHDIVGHPARVDSVLRDNDTLNGTQTLALLNGSPAIGAGDAAACAATGAGKPGGQDQRELPRPAATCAIGAYEPQPASPRPSPRPSAPPPGTPPGTPAALPPTRPPAPATAAPRPPTPNPLPARR